MGRITNGVKKVVTPFVNVKAWMGWNNLKSTTADLKGLCKEVLTVHKPKTGGETFEQAIQRLGLTEKDIQRRMQEFKYLAMLQAVLFVGVFLYSFYILFYADHIHGFFVGIALSLAIAALFFRFHFWYFQLKQRRLGCTFKDWLHGWIGKV
ncbi:MAG: type IVB secretion system protein IcmV [Gammaproteobacteria bacterium]